MCKALKMLMIIYRDVSRAGKISVGIVVSIIVVLMGLTLKVAYLMDKQTNKLKQGQIILENQKKILPF